MGALLFATVSGAALWGVVELRATLSEHEAVALAAETETPDEPFVPPRVVGSEPPQWQVEVDSHPRDPWVGVFGGHDDEALMAPLRDSAIKEVKVNHGGTSLSLRIDFENGARAACKPNQIYPQSQPRREIAAYRIDRLLGLSSVAPAVGRRLQVSDIVDHLRQSQSDQRDKVIGELVADDDGSVVTELSWWIPVIETARVDNFDVNSTDGVVTWKRYLTVGTPIPPEDQALMAQLSNMLLFDFVIDNFDRWSGGNVKVSEDRTTLYFMDNTFSLDDDWNGHTRTRTYLERSQKFSRRLVDALRHLRERDVRDAVTHDTAPFGPLLTDVEIKAVISRRDVALEYIDKLIADNGEDAVLAFP